MIRGMFIVAMLLVAGVANGQFESVNEAINVAGRQRMLSQRIAKDFLMISAKINEDKYQDELDLSMAMFEESHQMLREYCEQFEDVNLAMNEVQELWFNYRDIASSKEFSKTECTYLLSKAPSLLKATNKVVGLLEKTQSKTGNKDVAKLVNISGRQRMLSQKIGLYYVAAYLELPSPEIKKNFSDAVKLFDESLNFLIEQKDINTPEIAEKLDLVSKNWNFTKKSLVLEGRLKPATVAVSVNSLLKDMNTITGWYAKL